VDFVPGINYPWTVVGGQPNYGCDFGTNIWGSHTGVSTHQDDVRRDFEAMAAMGAEVVRWFVFTDGRGGVRWGPDRALEGLAPGVFEDMDAALQIAEAAGVRVCLVLFDFSWMLRWEQFDASGVLLFRTQPAVLASPEGQARVFRLVVDPVIARYGHGGPRADLGQVIHSFEVINEPDWVTRGLEPDWRLTPGAWRFRVPRPFTRAELRALVRSVADRVHAHTNALVTVGGGRVRFAAEWDDPAYGLDFIQLHLYPDVRYPRRDHALPGGHCSRLGLTKPVLIGEFPANGNRAHPDDHQPPPDSLTDYVDHARRHGYLGAWPWSFKGVDAFGAVDAAEMRACLTGPTEP